MWKVPSPPRRSAPGDDESHHGTAQRTFDLHGWADHGLTFGLQCELGTCSMCGGFTIVIALSRAPGPRGGPPA